MSSQAFITCCPNCHTEFSVKDGQLKVASGQVRCGACLHVFNALENERRKKAKAPLAQETITAASQEIEQEKSTERPTQSLNLDLSDLADDYYDVRAPQKKSGLISSFLFGIAICLSIGGLAGQLLWIKQSEWLYSNALYPIYQIAFQFSHQPIPVKTDRTKVVNKKLIVQPHSEYQDAIRVYLLLQNQADFSQPFPTLQMRFSDINGRPVAQRILAPQDYIDSSTFPNLMMPSLQPIQIQLDLMSPGRRAVSYQLELL